MKALFIIFLAFVALGFGIYQYIKALDQGLIKRTFTLGAEQMNILVPRNLIYTNTTDKRGDVATYSLKGQNISSVGITKSSSNSDLEAQRIVNAPCDSFKKQKVLVVNVKDFGKVADVCADDLQGNETYLNIDLARGQNVYVLSMFVDDVFFKTPEGQKKVKAVFESFNTN